MLYPYILFNQNVIKNLIQFHLTFTASYWLVIGILYSALWSLPFAVFLTFVHLRIINDGSSDYITGHEKIMEVSSSPINTALDFLELDL